MIHSFPAVHSYIRQLQSKIQIHQSHIDAQTKVIDHQSKVLAAIESHMGFLTNLLYTNGLHDTECKFAQSMRANERYKANCTCWIASAPQS